MSHDNEIPAVAIGDYVAVVLRRWRVVVLATLLGGGLAFGYLAVAVPEATATSVLAVSPIISDPYSANRSTSSLVDIQTEAQAASSMTIATLATDDLGTGVEPADLRSRLEITAVDATTVMRLSVTAPSAAQARAEADALADAYLSYRSVQAAERIQEILDQDQTRLDSLREQLSTANKDLAGAEVGSADAIQAQTDQQLAQTQIAALVDRSNTLLDIDTSGGEVLTSAEVNAVTWAPSRLPVLLGGLFAGGALGLAGAFVRQAMDRRVRLGADIVTAGVGPVLATLTGNDLVRTERDAAALAVTRERLLSTEALHGASGVLTLIEDATCPPAPDVAADLAIAFAEGGATVRVLCVPTADGYQATLARRLGLDHVNDDGVLGSSGQPLLSAWWSEERSGWPRAVERHVTRGGGTGLVILVCPASADDSDRMAASRIADGIVVYAVERVASRASLHSLALSAAAVQTPVLGAVITSSSPVQAEPDGAARRAARHAGRVVGGLWSPVSDASDDARRAAPSHAERGAHAKAAEVDHAAADSTAADSVAADSVAADSPTDAVPDPVADEAAEGRVAENEDAADDDTQNDDTQNEDAADEAADLTTGDVEDDVTEAEADDDEPVLLEGDDDPTDEVTSDEQAPAARTRA